MVEVPWVRKNSGFTLLFEALAMAMIEHEMPINKFTKFMRVLPQRIWTVFNHWIKKVYLADDVKGISKLGIDLSPSFISGAKAIFPDAKITFDRFHVVNCSTRLWTQCANSIEKNMNP